MLAPLADLLYWVYVDTESHDPGLCWLFQLTAGKLALNRLIDMCITSTSTFLSTWPTSRLLSVSPASLQVSSWVCSGRPWPPSSTLRSFSSCCSASPSSHPRGLKVLLLFIWLFFEAGGLVRVLVAVVEPRYQRTGLFHLICYWTESPWLKLSISFGTPPRGVRKGEGRGVVGLTC